MRCFTVLGDVIASRRQPDQPALIAKLQGTLDWALASIAPENILQPLQVTIGDEFQGAFRELGSALRAALRVELRLAGSLSVRFGIGHGEIEGYRQDQGPLGQSGSAWWTARQAIERVEALEREKRPFRRVAFESDDRVLAAAMEAWLTLRDRLFAELDATDLAILLGLEEGVAQTKIAQRLHIDPAAITRRKVRRGIDTLRATYRAFDELALAEPDAAAAPQGSRR